MGDNQYCGNLQKVVTFWITFIKSPLLRNRRRKYISQVTSEEILIVAVILFVDCNTDKTLKMKF
jgi:hypothetical protein